MKKRILTFILGFVVIAVTTAALDCGCLFAETHMGSDRTLKMEHCQHGDSTEEAKNECADCTVQKAIENSNRIYLGKTTSTAGFFNSFPETGSVPRGLAGDAVPKFLIKPDTSPPAFAGRPLYLLNEAFLI